MPTCQVCQSEIYYDYEKPDYTNRKPYTVMDRSREAAHSSFCKPRPNPIRLYDNIGGIQFDRREDWIAKDIVDEAVRCKLDPFRVRVVRQGDFLLLK